LSPFYVAISGWGLDSGNGFDCGALYG